MGAKYKFYEIVRIITGENTGKEGAIMGMAQDDDGLWGYAVHVYEDSIVWDYLETDLESTGKMDKRESFYSGETIKVYVDPETGEGTSPDLEG